MLRSLNRNLPNEECAEGSMHVTQCCVKGRPSPRCLFNRSLPGHEASIHHNANHEVAILLTTEITLNAEPLHPLVPAVRPCQLALLARFTPSERFPRSSDNFHSSLNAVVSSVYYGQPASGPYDNGLP